MCGMTRAEDIAQAIQLGVDAIGLIFYEKSARYVTIDKAKELLKNLPPFVAVVAVLVNPEKQFVQELLKELPIQLLQFHGDESPAFCQQFNKAYIKAIHPESSETIEKASQDYAKAEALLLDTASSTQRGGTGQTFDWSLIPKALTSPLILAGGLNEFNVGKALKACNPYAVDICSGIEALPGVKDPHKMNRFIKVLWGVK